MARGEREAGREEAGEGAVRGTGGFKLSRQQPRCQEGRLRKGTGAEGAASGSHTPDIYTPGIYTP